MNKTGMIILAAGDSSRLGRPKQLLPYRGRTLLTHVAAEALAADVQPVVVVTGAYQAEIRDALKGQPVSIIHNPRWETGMASGIVAGLTEALVIEPRLQAIIVAVCDQPYISAELFRSLMKKFTTSGKGLIACTYAETMGTPVLFGWPYFNALTTLSGDTGAKQLLKQYPDDVATVPFPKGGIDIDTEEDVKEII
ncbi:MAG TPA: nucleotidyltransferase family protein [Puia sp.]|nr:nucleotidyltransferase family protein [Puia sp.]